MQLLTAEKAYFSPLNVSPLGSATQTTPGFGPYPGFWPRYEGECFLADHGAATRLSPTDVVRAFSLTPLARHDSRILNRVRLSPRILGGADFQPAAVLIGLVPRPSGIHLVLTQRASHLKHHPGQVSFPGGKRESIDHDNIATATREMWEETGIRVTRDAVIGHLCPLPTVTGYYIHPVLAWVDPDYQPCLDPNEVAACFEVPLDTLCYPGHIREQSFLIDGQWHPVSAFYHHDHLVWGATAQLLRALISQLTLFHFPVNRTINPTNTMESGAI
ncbi:NUDIX hydrolase [Salinivibrio sp. MA607]|uniref:NUDIX hydrolase n=1 Tax=Salinivibrio sp. MA607 TaxID=1909457 RepID=UPI000988C56A|nr:CoA pyrophosphatase [Salinivibrio sp. MA607]OOF05604.1 hypothetical protein BZG81_05790 [Salinivibrio sp. MA607]